MKGLDAASPKAQALAKWTARDAKCKIVGAAINYEFINKHSLLWLNNFVHSSLIQPCVN
jgi:hypothetical protein